MEWRRYKDGSQSCCIGQVMPSLSRTNWIADRLEYKTAQATHYKNLGYFPTLELAKAAVIEADAQSYRDAQR